jgi:hypothetical protein
MGRWPYEERQRVGYYRKNEALEQMILMAWAMGEESAPWLGASYLYHTPNGEYRDERTVMPLALMGVRKGIPDLHLPVQSSCFSSLYIEMKKMGEKQTPEQVIWQRILEAMGHVYRIAYTWEQGRDYIIEYLEDNMQRKGDNQDA